MAQLSFSEEVKEIFYRERFEHPHPRVQQRMEIMWLLSQGVTNIEAARLGGVSHATVDRYIAIFRSEGIDGLRRFRWVGQTSELLKHQTSLEESFLKQPPHTVAEAQHRIKELTGLDRGPTQVRAFLKKCWV
jgi:transposase